MVTAEGQSVFLFSAIGKHPIEMYLVHKVSFSILSLILNRCFKNLLVLVAYQVTEVVSLFQFIFNSLIYLI